MLMMMMSAFSKASNVQINLQLQSLTRNRMVFTICFILFLSSIFVKRTDEVVYTLMAKNAGEKKASELVSE